MGHPAKTMSIGLGPGGPDVKIWTQWLGWCKPLEFIVVPSYTHNTRLFITNTAAA